MSTIMAKTLPLAFQLQTCYPVQAYSLHILAASLHTSKLIIDDLPFQCRTSTSATVTEKQHHNRTAAARNRPTLTPRPPGGVTVYCPLVPLGNSEEDQL